MNMSKKKQKQLPDAVTCVVVSMNDEIHIDDFLRLTGKCLGDNGTYRIEESGVTGEVGDISEVVGLTSEDQAVLLEFKRKAKLDFPCTPQRLIEWVKDTDGEFTLPVDFVRQIEEAKVEVLLQETARPRGVNGNKIMGGRPKEIDKKADLLRKLISLMHTDKTLDPGALPGSVADFLDACQRIEKAKTNEINVFSTTKETIKTWLIAAGYRVKIGRTSKDEAKYWTRLCVETMGKIPPDVFT